MRVQHQVAINDIPTQVTGISTQGHIPRANHTIAKWQTVVKVTPIQAH